MADEKRNERDLTGRRMARRDFLRMAAFGTAGLTVAQLLAACGGSSSNTPASSGGASTSTSSSAGASTSTAASGGAGATKAPATSAATPASNAGVATPVGGAAAPTGKIKDTLMIGFPTDVTTLDIHKVTGLHLIGFDGQIGDGLIHLDSESKAVPWLVEKWDWTDDGKTLKLTMRQNVKMHDGNVMTAEDVRYSIERFRKLSVGGSALSMVTGIEAPDNKTVLMKMAAPFPPLLPSLAYTTIGIYSKAAIEKVGDDAFGKAPVGTGPYKFVEQKKGESVKLEAFDDYWAGKPKTKYVVARALPEMGARVAALESGDVDLIFNVSPQDADRLKKNSKLQVLTPPSARLDRFQFNTSRPPFDKKEVRQAVAYGIDRDAIVKTIFLGLAEVTHSPGPNGAFGYTGEYDVYKYDPNKAKAMLKQAGMDSLNFKFHLAPGRYLLDQNAVELMRAQLKPAGMDMEIVQMEWGALSQYIRQDPAKMDFQSVFLGWRSINGDVDSAISDLATREFPPDGNNTSLYSNPAYDKLLEQEQSEADPAKRETILKQMQKILMEDLPFIPLYHEPQIWAAKAGVKNVVISPLTCLLPLNEAFVEG